MMLFMVENKIRRKAHKSISLFSFYVPRVATKLVPFTLEQVMEYVFCLEHISNSCFHVICKVK